jgi:hypothetical protein
LKEENELEKPNGVVERAVQETTTDSVLRDWERKGISQLWDLYAEECGSKDVAADPDQTRREFIDRVTGVMMSRFRFQLGCQEANASTPPNGLTK